jgi:hypothetical protein
VLDINNSAGSRRLRCPPPPIGKRLLYWPGVTTLLASGPRLSILIEQADQLDKGAKNTNDPCAAFD